MRDRVRRTAQPHQPDADVVRLGRRAHLLLRPRSEGRQPAPRSGVHRAGRSQREISGAAGGDGAGSRDRYSKTLRPKRPIRICAEARVQMGRKYNGGHGAAAVDDPPPNGASAGGRNRRWVVRGAAITSSPGTTSSSAGAADAVEGTRGRRRRDSRVLDSSRRTVSARSTCRAMRAQGRRCSSGSTRPATITTFMCSASTAAGA